MNSFEMEIIKDRRYLNLLFHEVVDDPNASGLVRKSALPYKHTIEQFDKYLEVLPSYVSSISIPSHPHWNSIGKKVSITFDDGGISNMKSAEMLEEIGVSALFFVVTNSIGKRGFLSEMDVRELHARGHSIGSHSHTHPNVFKSLSKSEMDSEWGNSKEILENIVQNEITICSIPGGDASLLAYETAQTAGYTKLFDSEPILELRKIDNLDIYGRFCLKTSHSAAVMKSWLDSTGIKKYQRIWNVKKSLKKIGYPLYKLKRSLD